MTLEKELEDLKLELGADEFRDAIADSWFALFPSVPTEEELLCKPTECAVPLCREVRRRLGRTRLGEFLILKTLLNMRKSPVLHDKHLARRKKRRKKAAATAA